MKRKTLNTLVAAAMSAFAFASTSAQAATIQFLDVQTKGTTDTFVSLDTLYSNVIQNNGFYQTLVNIGADYQLSNGDVFNESLVLTSSFSLLGPASSIDLVGDYKIVANLTGQVQNLVGGTFVLNPNSSVSTVGTPFFDVSFTSAVIELWDKINNIKVSDLTLLNGGASGIQLVSGQLIGDVTLNAFIGPCTANCDDYLADFAGNSVDGQDITTITTGSARFQGFAGSSYANGILAVNFKDNGQSTTIPEPASLALAGLGLLGIGALRRRKLSA